MTAELLRAALGSGLLAGLVAIAVTRGVERWGGRIGGLVGTLPTTIVAAAGGIWLGGGGAEAMAAAMAATPAGMLVNAAFLLLWRLLPPHLPAWSPRRRLLLMTAVALSFWGGAAAAILLLLGRLMRAGWPPREVGLVGTVLVIGVGLLGSWRALPSPAGRRPVMPLVLASRGVLAALAIAAAVVLAASQGGLVAGLASVFPAIFLTTMVSLWLAQGEAVQVGAVGPMMLGSASVATYSQFAAWALPAYGLIAGSLLAWGLAVATTTLPASFWLSGRARAASI